MECEKYGDLWSHHVPTDILKSISSRLIAGDYFAFCAVCKTWRADPLPPQLHDDSSPSPCLMTLHGQTGIVQFFDPVYNALIPYKSDIPRLRGSRIRCAKANWLLMSHGNLGMFFFNPKSNGIIEFPDLPVEQNFFSAWTFSCPPDSSSDCFVVGIVEAGSPPNVCIIKVGANTTWTYIYFLNEYKNSQELFTLTGCNNLVFFKNNIVHVLGDKGNLGILRIMEDSAETPTWEFYGKPFLHQNQKLIREVYTVEDVDNGGMLAVFLTQEEGKVEVWRYKMNGRVLEREQITSLDNKTLFVSFGVSHLKPCVAPGLANKIYFPMFYDNDKGIFYYLATRKYYSFDYSLK